MASNINDVDIATVCVLAAAQQVVTSQEKKALWTDSERKLKHNYTSELLGCGHEGRIYRVLRMKLSTFYSLRDWCVANTQLRGSKTRDVTIEEKLLIFLWIVSNGISNRAAQEVFARSGDTVSRCFNEVLQALVLLHKEVVKLPTHSTPLASRIANDQKYTP